LDGAAEIDFAVAQLVKHADRREAEPELVMNGVEIDARNAASTRIASPRMLLDNFSPMTGTAPPNRFGGLYGGKDQHGRAA
jgi:hypothetical protein